MTGRQSKARARIARFVIPILAVGTTLALAQPARATTPGTNGKVVFASNRDKNYEIYTMNADGTSQTRLTTVAGDDIQPTWSADGMKIAFVSKRDGNFEIYSMNANGSSQTRLTNDKGVDGEPTWSPDGMKIAFVSNRDGHDEIYTMNADGSSQTRVTATKQADDTPNWSPDGKKIAFASTRSGNYEIYTMNTDGSAITRLTKSPGVDDFPNWSPDGKTIAFESNGAGKTFSIYTVNAADGSGRARLTWDTNHDDREPVWSGDGKQIVFTSTRNANYSNAVGPWQVFEMQADGSEVTLVSKSSSDDIFPSWQSMGKPACMVPLPAPIGCVV